MISPPTLGPRIGASIAGTGSRLITRTIRLVPAASAITICPTAGHPAADALQHSNRISSGADEAMPHSAEPAVNSTSDNR